MSRANWCGAAPAGNRASTGLVVDVVFALSICASPPGSRAPSADPSARVCRRPTELRGSYVGK